MNSSTFTHPCCCIRSKVSKFFFNFESIFIQFNHFKWCWSGEISIVYTTGGGCTSSTAVTTAAADITAAVTTAALPQLLKLRPTPLMLWLILRLPLRQQSQIQMSKIHPLLLVIIWISASYLEHIPMKCRSPYLSYI
jgi:hypothetical protein